MSAEVFALPAKRAAEVVGVSTALLREWANERLVTPQVWRRLRSNRHVRLYSMEDLVALWVATRLRNEVSGRALRKTIAHLRSRGYEKPLTELSYAVAGREIYFQHPDTGAWEGHLSPDQIVFHEVIDLQEIRTLIRHKASRQSIEHGRIIRERGRVGSKPVFAGTRIPVESVVAWLNAGFSSGRILSAYPDLVEADIEAARSFDLAKAKP